MRQFLLINTYNHSNESTSFLLNADAAFSSCLSVGEWCEFSSRCTDGHDIEAPWDEAVTLREGIQYVNHTLEEISIMALKGMYKPASTSGN